MGMFDYIRCQMPLPEHPAPPAIEWMQTKDTPDQYMSRYTITHDGRLIWHSVERKWCDDPSSLLGGWMKPFKEENIEISNWHGDIWFGEFNTKTGESWDYVARFTEGRCVRVWLATYETIKAGSQI